MSTTDELIKKFDDDAKDKSFDLLHRKKINFNIAQYNSKVVVGQSQFVNLDLAREKAKNIKWNAIENLDTYLETFEKNITTRGAKVIWAQDIAEAQNAILEICQSVNCKTLVKSKSMVTEEIHLNEFLEQNNIASIETDLGEYIQQLDGEPPYHIVTPAMHKSKEDCAMVFHKHLGTDINLTPKELTLVAREKLREKYIQAEVGVTGGNFLIADIGAIAVTENEGNARLSSAWPKVHIAIVGIEKMLPSVNDLSLFWPLLSSFGTGQEVTVYNSLFLGPKQSNETDGPEQMFVILLDNGRTNILANPKQRETLYCIRCGACLNACPVYKNIGGHTYNTTYSGPIGAVISPNLNNLDEYKHLSYASSLCGNCTEVCAVKINLHEKLLDNRIASVTEGYTTFAERAAWKLWRIASQKRSLMNTGNANLKNTFINMIFKGWKSHRTPMNFSKKTFNEMWEKRGKGI